MSSINLGEDTFSIIRKHRHVLTGCSSCHALWIAKEKIASTPLSERDFWQLSKAIVAFNENGLTYNDLLAANVEQVTYSLCPRCTANNQSLAKKIQASQLAEGNFPCFGSAKDGYCDRFDCNKRLLCIHDEENPPNTIGFFRKLYHEVQHHLVAN